MVTRNLVYVLCYKCHVIPSLKIDILTFVVFWISGNLQLTIYEEFIYPSVSDILEADMK